MTKKSEQRIGMLDFVNHRFDADTLNDIKDQFNDQTLIEAIVSLRDAYFIDEAIDLAEFGIKRYSYRTRFYILLGDLLASDSSYDQALKVVNQGLLASPFDAELIILKTRILCALEEYIEAEGLLDALLSQSFFIGESALYIARAYLAKAQKNYEEMYFFAKLAFELDPHLKSVHQVYGDAVELSREYTDSVMFLNDLIDENPYHYLAWFHLGHAYSSLGRYDRAITAFEYAFIAEKNYRPAYLECADLCVELGHYRKTILVNLEIRERFGENAESYAQMTKSYLKLNLHKEANEHVQALASLDSEHEELWILKGECYINEKDWKMAIMSFKKALMNDEENDEYLFKIARCYEKLKDFSQSCVYFRRAIDLGPEEYSYWYYFIKYLLRRKRFSHALLLIDEAEEYTFSYKLYYLRAACLFYLNRNEEGRSALEEAMQDGFCDRKLLAKIFPEYKRDKEIISMLEFYKQ